MSAISNNSPDRPAGSGLVRHRWKAALTIAAAEGVLAAVEGTSRWVLIAVALLVLFVYFRWGRSTESALVGRLAWIGAASQVLILVLALAAFFVGLLVLVGVAVLAVAAFVLLVLERGR